MKKVCRKCETEKPLDEYYRDKKASDGKHSWCKECVRAKRRKYHYDNHEKSTATSRAWKAKNAERNKAITAAWRVENKGYMAAKQSEYRGSNRELVNATHREWCRANPKKKAAVDQRRRARLIAATPDWISDEDLAPFYHQAALMEEVTGVKHEVDHIVPICNDMVSGLNVPWNLQVITRSENARKSNTFEVG